MRENGKPRRLLFVFGIDKLGLQNSPEVASGIFDFYNHLVVRRMKFRPIDTDLRLLYRLLGEQVHGVRQFEADVHPLRGAKRKSGKCGVDYEPRGSFWRGRLIEDKKSLLRLNAKAGSRELEMNAWV